MRIFYLVVLVVMALAIPFPQQTAGGFTSSSLLTGFNWVPGAGDTPSSALAKIGGTMYRSYGFPLSGGSSPNEIRLLRYRAAGAVQTCGGLPRYVAYGPEYSSEYYCPGEITAYAASVRGHTWQLGNEINLQEQDYAGGDVLRFSHWLREVAHALHLVDSESTILGPSTWNWRGQGCCLGGDRILPPIVGFYGAHYDAHPAWDRGSVSLYSASAPSSSALAGLKAEFDAARVYYASLGLPVGVTEWGASRYASDTDRYAYAYDGLAALAAGGATFALWCPSHHDPGNPGLAPLVNTDGSLSPEGRAHRDFVLGVATPTPGAQATPTVRPGRRL